MISRYNLPVVPAVSNMLSWLAKMDSCCIYGRCLRILAIRYLCHIGNTIVCKLDVVYTRINLTDVNIKMPLEVVGSPCFVEKTCGHIFHCVTLMFAAVATLKIHNPTKTHRPNAVKADRPLQGVDTLVPFVLFMGLSLRPVPPPPTCTITTTVIQHVVQ
jgi:hypothetical protein